jgi:aldehyde oxidoreductase
MNHPLESGLRAALSDITLSVNGRAMQIAAAPATPLANVLRDELQLTGTKIGCDAGDCGACTVLLDGEQVCSCITATAQCAGRAITTIEGLAEDGMLTRLQQAFLKHGAAQCGICTPGMLMAATSLLKQNPSPTEAETQDALGGVLCRCTGYRKIIDAVLDVAQGDLALEAPAVGHAVGARIARLDGVGKVTGHEKFGADFAPAGSLWLRVLRSPYPRARFVVGDLEAWRNAQPGVAGVISAADVPENSFAVFPVPKDQPVLADGHVRFRGEAVLGIIGERDALLALDMSGRRARSHR